MLQFVFLQYLLALCAGVSGLTVMVIQYRLKKTAVIRDLFFYDMLCFVTILVYGIGSYLSLFGYRVPAWYQHYSIPVFMVLACVRFVFIVRLTVDLVGMRVRVRLLSAVFAATVVVMFVCAYAYFVSFGHDDKWTLYLTIRSVLKGIFAVFPVFCCCVYLLIYRRGVHSSVYRLWSVLAVILILSILLYVVLFIADPDLCMQYVDILMIVFFLSNAAYTAFYARSYRFDSAGHSATAPEPVSYEAISRSHGISKREYEIVMLVSEGHSYAKIGELLFISPNTVRNHVSNAYRKLGIENKIQLFKVLHTR